MKKLLIIVGAIVVVALSVGLSVNHYKNYQNKKQAQATPTISVKQADLRVKQAKAASTTEYNSLVVQYNQAVAECQKGVAAYAKLTHAQQIQTASPVCPAAKS